MANETFHRLCALGCCLVIGASSPRESFAQSSHVLGATLSLGSSSARDDLLIPLAFTGPALGLGGRYSLTSGTHSAELELEMGIGLLSNRFGHPAEQLSHGVAAGYGRALRLQADSRTDLVLLLRWQDELTYFESWDDAHGYWLSSLMLTPALRDARPLVTDVMLESRAELALLGIAARPPRRRWNKQDALTMLSYHVDRLGDGTRFVSALDVQALRAEALMRFRDERQPVGAGFGTGLLASFSRAADPEAYSLLEVQLVVAYGGEL